jgi:hypothetical protein
LLQEQIHSFRRANKLVPTSKKFNSFLRASKHKRIDPIVGPEAISSSCGSDWWKASESKAVAENGPIIKSMGLQVGQRDEVLSLLRAVFKLRGYCRLYPKVRNRQAAPRPWAN